MSNDKEIFARTLRELMRSKGQKSCEQLARRLHVPMMRIYSYASGRHYPRLQNVEMIADYFYVSIDYLLRGREYAH